MRRFLPALFLLVCASAAAAPPLDPYAAPSFSVGLPRGWKVTADAARGLIIAQEDPARKDAAALVLMTSDNASQTADQLLDAVAAQIAGGLKVVRREAIPGGSGALMVADGRAGDVPVRLGVVGLAQGATSVVCLVVARPRQFDELGGIDLVVAVLSSIQSNAPAAQQAPAASAPTRPLRVADLAGEWKLGDSTSITNYVNSSTGAYAGYTSISTRDHWIIAANGRLQGDFQGAHLGNGGTYAVSSKYSGTVTISPDGTVLSLKKDSEPLGTNYIVHGWEERPNGTVLILNGPFYKEIPPDCLDPKRCTNLNNTWVRPRATK